MTHTGRVAGLHSPGSAAPPSYSPTELSIRDILERWVGTDETLRAALNAHSSASNRRAEEERTRQEYYRLETRRVEYDLLREAFRGGIHPSVIPQMFTQERHGGPQSLSPISPITRHDDRPPYSTSSVPSYNRHDLPRIDTTNLPPPTNRTHLVPSHREKYAGPISAPPASMATTSPPPSIFFRHWAPPQSRPDEIGLRTPREDGDLHSSSTSTRYHTHPEHQIPSPSSARKSPPSYTSNGISPKRSAPASGSHGRQRSDAALTGKMHESRHHPYPNRPLQKKHEQEENGTGLGGTKSSLDRETVMRALREKVGPRREEEKDDQERKENEKKEAERKKVETTRDVMALEQLVESNGTSQKV